MQHKYTYTSWCSWLGLLILSDVYEYGPLVSPGYADALFIVKVEDVEVAFGSDAERKGDDQAAKAELDLEKIESIEHGAVHTYTLLLF